MLKTRENRRYQILCNVVLALLTIFMVFPFALLFMSSITEENTLIMNGYTLFPRKLSLEAYKYMVLVRKCVGKVISLTPLPFLHPYCCGNSLYQLLPMRFPSID